MVTIFEAASRRVGARPGLSAFRRGQLEMASSTSAALTGSAVFFGVALLLILTMVRTRPVKAAAER